MGKFPPNEHHALLYTERIASAFSLAGTMFIFFTFIFNKNFRKPINRLVFYASWGNTLCNVATLISMAGIVAGKSSALCQLQGFLIQMFLPADASWNLCMAITVYMTVFKKYGPMELRALEWKYMLGTYGLSFIIALLYCFIESDGRGKIYGPAVLWCWIDIKWDFLRIITCYAPAWFCILTTFTIYLRTGLEIFKRRSQLRSFANGTPSETSMIENPFINPFSSFKTTEVTITSELVNLPHSNGSQASLKFDSIRRVISGQQSYEQYSVTIERGPMSPIFTYPKSISPHFQAPHRNAAMEANAAAYSYLKCAMLFFVSLMITWVPSSINRVYSLIHPEVMSFPFNYSAGLVLPLMGFWNTVIYIVTSWDAVKSLVHSAPSRMRPTSLMRSAGDMGRARTVRSGGVSIREISPDRTRRGHKRNSLSDSMKGLADAV